jgi:kynurenine formamidase
MKVIDLTHTVTPAMPVYPGSKTPRFSTPCTIEKDGFLERIITLSSHTGTHIDAPAHIIPLAATLDRLPVSRFAGSAAVIDLTGLKSARIEPRELLPYEGLIKNSEFVLIFTGWSRYWGEQEYFRGYPVLTDEAALRLADFQLKGVGVDVISVDEAGSTELPIHKILLGRGLVVIENLAHLDQLPSANFTFCCFPLKLGDAEASPVRAAAICR